MADRYVLLVEGRDDVHVLKNLGNHHSIEFIYQKSEPKTKAAIKIEDLEGVDQLLEILEVRAKAGIDSGLERLGVVVDADTDIQARWAALRNRLIKSGFQSKNVPKSPNPKGTVIEQDGRPVVGIWLMPDNKLAGEAVGLEHFIEFLVPEGDTLWNIAEQCLNSIPDEERRFGIHSQKAHVHTWLAWQKEPGKPMGQAITAKYLDADASYAQLFVEWLRRLFGVS